MEWIDKVEYPFRSNYIEIGGNKIHYVDEGSGEKTRAAVLFDKNFRTCFRPY